VVEFDKLVQEADCVIGKNNWRFDDKHINTQRWMVNEVGRPEWTKKSDDLEHHLRRNLALPSYKLDYVSKILGFGGKNKMELSDWIAIVEQDPVNGMACFLKMLRYNKKDVADTRSVWNHSVKHFIPKLNQSALFRGLCCSNCGSYNIYKHNYQVTRGKTVYDQWYCNDHSGWAGQTVYYRNLKRDGSSIGT